MYVCVDFIYCLKFVKFQQDPLPDDPNPENDIQFPNEDSIPLNTSTENVVCMPACIYYFCFT